MSVICQKCPPSAHIEMRCKAHREKTWSTKNIPGRSLFYNLFSDPDMGRECNCPGSALYHHCPEEHQERHGVTGWLADGFYRDTVEAGLWPCDNGEVLADDFMQGVLYMWLHNRYQPASPERIKDLTSRVFPLFKEML